MSHHQKITAVNTRDPHKPGSEMTGVSVTSTESPLPLPPAEELERLEKLFPSITQKLVEAFIAQGTHRQNLETIVITGDNHRANLGQRYAFILGMTALVGGFALIGFGHDGLGIAAIITSLATLLTAFFGGSLLRFIERKSKNSITKS